MNEEVREEKRNEVGELLRSLRPVEAPANFEFGLKAKIARGAPKTQQTGSLWRLARYAVPFALVLIIGGVLVLNSLYFVGERDVADIPSVTEQKTEVPQTAENKEVTRQANSDEIAIRQPATAPPAIKPFLKVKSIPIQQKRAEDPRGGSYDAAQRIREPIYPKGSNPLQNNEITVEGALGYLGIDAALDGAHWKVISVKKKSIAERAGLKVGDQPETIDNLPLTGTTDFKRPFSPKAISVIRDGKSIKIVLP